MKNKAAVKKHIKMYSDDEFIALVQVHAEKEGLSQSAYILTATKAKIKKDNK